MSSLNWVDNVILFVFFMSVVAGLMRGLVKEVISLLTWLAAFVVAVLFSSKLAGIFTSSHQVQSMISGATSSIGINTAQPVSVLSLGLSFVLLFVGTLIVGSIINSMTSKAVERTGISFSNRLLGSVFGLGRGFLIALVGIFVVQLSPIQQESYWSQSQFVTAFQPAVQWLGGIVQPGFDSLKSKVSDTLQNTNTQQLFQGR
jgi:membrane protein required for colicin V production